MKQPFFYLSDKETVAKIHQVSERYRKLFESIQIASNEYSQKYTELFDKAKAAAEAHSPFLTKEQIETLNTAYAALYRIIPNVDVTSRDEPINISDTAISEVVDEAIPIIDEMELSEPQRRAVEEYKESKTLTLENILIIIQTIIMLLDLLCTIADSLNSNHEQEAHQTVIVENRSEYHITQYNNYFTDSDNAQSDSSD